MKFSKQLMYNAVAEWRQHYMDYAGLKKLLSRIKKLQRVETTAAGAALNDAAVAIDSPAGSSGAANATPSRGLVQSTTLPRLHIERTASARVLLDLEEEELRSSSATRRRSSRLQADDREQPSVDATTTSPLMKLSRMYGATDPEAPLFDDENKFQTLEQNFFSQLEVEAERVELFYKRMDRVLRRIGHSLVKHTEDALAKQPSEESERVLLALRRRYVEHYLEVAELLNFAELNYTGFEKIMKKHDKVTQMSKKEHFLQWLSKYSFTKPVELEEQRQHVQDEFARCYWDGDMDRAARELEDSLRELVIWERNTIWRDMLLSERRVRAITSKRAGKKGQVRLAALKPKAMACALALLVATVALAPALFGQLSSSKEHNHHTLGAAQRCLGLVVFAAFMWATETVPLYVTALLLPTLCVTLQVFIGEDGKVLPTADAAKLAVSSMSTSVILLIIGGYTLAAAFSKFSLDKTLATLVLTRVGRPKQMLFVLMLLAVFLSMWLSNVATPVLLNSVVSPIVRGLPQSSLPLVKCLLLGIALASNIGGMATPIASPQNAVALSTLQGMQQISFLQWLAVTLPSITLMLICGHALLTAWFRPGQFVLPIIPGHIEPLAMEHLIIIATLCTTVVLWCWKSALDTFGRTAGGPLP